MNVMKVDDRDVTTVTIMPAPDMGSAAAIGGGEEAVRESFPESLFDRCSWFYAICREHLFRDHTAVIARALLTQQVSDSGVASSVNGSLDARVHVVEVGCGPGFYATRLAEGYPWIRTTGIDLCERLLQRAKTRAQRRSLANCAFYRGDAHALPLMLGRVDAVVASRLFLVVEDREVVVREIFRVLRPGGRCFIAEPLSGFRTRVPLACMWLLSKFPRRPAVGYREPHHAAVLSKGDFLQLIEAESWSSIRIEYDGRYQYAVCEKGRADGDGRDEIEAGSGMDEERDLSV